MGYTEAKGKADHDGLVRLASDLINANTVNEVLHGVSVASRAREYRRTDETLELARKGGSRVGYLFRPESERVFRKRCVSDSVRNAFEKTAYNGENPEGLTYTRENDLAIVLYDNEFPYITFGIQFVHFLRDRLGFRKENIFSLPELCGQDINKAGNALINSGSKIKTIDTFANVIVYYTGRGGKGCLSINDEEIKYSSWISSFKGHEGNMVFVHDTAFAGSLEPELKKAELLPGKAMLLAACSRSKPDHGNHFSRAVMRTYGSGDVYKPEAMMVEVGNDPIPEPVGEFLRLFGFSFPIEDPHEEEQEPLKSGAELDYLLRYYGRPSLKDLACFD